MSLILKIWLGLIVLTGILISVHGLELSVDVNIDQGTASETFSKNEAQLILHDFQNKSEWTKKSLNQYPLARP